MNLKKLWHHFTSPKNITHKRSCAVFCRHCGCQLLKDSLFCSKCGTKVDSFKNSENNDDSSPLISPPQEQNSEDQIANISAAYNNQQEDFAAELTEDVSQTSEEKDNFDSVCKNVIPPKIFGKKIKLIVIIVASLILLTGVVLLVIHFVPPKISPQDISTINGAPEFYNVTFGMSVQEASALIEIKHKASPGLKSSLGDIESYIFFDKDADFGELYDIPIKNALCTFDNLKLNLVVIVFDKEEVSCEEIIELYTKIYGNPSNSSAWLATWNGPKTTINIYDSSLLEDNSNEVIVRYQITPNSQYKALSFGGSKIDPCGFLSENYAFSQTINHYINGLELDGDYIVEDFTTDGDPSFFQYTLYPSFEYMGVTRGYTAIQFNVDDQNIHIESVSYLFLLNADNVVDIIKNIKNTLSTSYGTYLSCGYTSLRYNELGIEDLDYETFIARIENGTQGIYHIQWITKDMRITLGLTISPEKKYYQGEVAFAKQNFENNSTP